MRETASVSPQRTGASSEASFPYAPSWYDGLQAWIDDLPLPAWSFYVVVCLVAAALLNLGTWLSGYLPAGTFDPYVNSGAVYLVIGYWGMHYLDKAAARAWTTFRSATRLGDDEARRYAYELTTMPAGHALIASVAGVVGAAVFLASQYGRPFDLEHEPVVFVATVVVVVVGFIGTAAAFYHSIHQLRVIARAHEFVDSIDLLHLQPLHAFAAVTALTGLLLMAIGYVAVPTNPIALDNPAVVATAIGAIVLAIACFVVPLVGIHDAIAAEKSRRHLGVSRLLADGLADLHHRAERRDLTDADKLDKQLTNLLAERELIARASTWPWGTDTLRGFTAAIVVPVGLWLVYRYLGQVI